jgi:SAM-dependent methyltransferase
MRLPREVLDARRRIAEPYLRGHGIEIGALHAPTELPPGASVRYVDFRTIDELQAQYPKMEGERLVPVDVVDDGETLTSFADHSVDFLIANHMLEHCENPLGAMRTHLRKVRSGGWLFYALPDRRVGFDNGRPITPFDHLVADDRDGGAASRFGHYVEWAKCVRGITDEDAAMQSANKDLARRFSIHYHVWDSNAWFDTLSRARPYLGDTFEVRHFEFTGTEIVCVLRRD